MKMNLLAFVACLPLFAQAQYLAHNPTPKDKELERTFQAGERAYRSGDLTLAIDLFDKVLAEDPEHINAYLQRGFSHSLNKDYSSAVKDFTSVLERKPDHLWAYTSRGGALNRLGRYAEAIEDFNAVIALDPRNEEAYNNRGWAYKGMDDLQAACKDWNTSKRMGNSEARIILSNTRCK
jgi:tetratricopeptide (TPR) repeat protein